MALSKFWIYTYLVGMVFWGSANTILLSLQFEVTVLGVKYGHPWFQTFTMFLGETYCLVVYYLGKWYRVWRKKNKPIETDEETEEVKNQHKLFVQEGENNSAPVEKELETEDEDDLLEKGPTEEVMIDGTPKTVPKEASIFLIFIPSLCDFGGSTLLAFALLNMETSIYQMLRG